MQYMIYKFIVESNYYEMMIVWGSLIHEVLRRVFPEPSLTMMRDICSAFVNNVDLDLFL